MFKFLDSWQSGEKAHIKNFKSISIFCIILPSRKVKSDLYFFFRGKIHATGKTENKHLKKTERSPGINTNVWQLKFQIAFTVYVPEISKFIKFTI